MKVLINPQCSKCRHLERYLNDKKVSYEKVLYLSNHPSKEELTEIVEKLGQPAYNMIRHNDPLFKEKYKGVAKTDAEWIEFMAENPQLIQRPIVVLDDKAIIARSKEAIDSIFS